MASSEQADRNKHLQLEQMQQSSPKPVQQAKAAAWLLYCSSVYRCRSDYWLMTF